MICPPHLLPDPSHLLIYTSPTFSLSLFRKKKKPRIKNKTNRKYKTDIGQNL